MAAKRRPGNQLTQDNWDDDEAPQEACISILRNSILIETAVLLWHIVFLSTS